MCSRVVREGHSIGSLGDDGAISDHHRGKRPASPAAHILNGQRDGLLHKPVLHAPTSRGPRLYRNLLPTNLCFLFELQLAEPETKRKRFPGDATMPLALLQRSHARRASWSSENSTLLF